VAFSPFQPLSVKYFWFPLKPLSAQDELSEAAPPSLKPLFFSPGVAFVLYFVLALLSEFFSTGSLLRSFFLSRLLSVPARFTSHSVLWTVLGSFSGPRPVFIGTDIHANFHQPPSRYLSTASTAAHTVVREEQIDSTVIPRPPVSSPFQMMGPFEVREGPQLPCGNTVSVLPPPRLRLV